MRSALLLSIVAIGLGAAAPAVADQNLVSVPVNIADLDLSKPTDATRLRTRLNRAAQTACQDPGTSGVSARMAFTSCRSTALSHANLKAERAIAAARIGGTAEIKTARR